MLSGERGVDEDCRACHVIHPVQVCKSFAGYYIGRWCPRSGPISRDSGYYTTGDAAKSALEKGTYSR